MNSPIGDTSDTTPSYRWSAVSGATGYVIGVENITNINWQSTDTTSVQASLFFVFSHALAAEDYVVYYHNDALGSPVAATNEQGTVLWKEHYLAYGEKVINELSASNEKLGYTGQAFDSETGLNYYGARYYDPVVGRFMGIDPVGFQQANIHSFNRYAYANNNPIKFVDPDGRYSVMAFTVAGCLLMN